MKKTVLLSIGFLVGIHMIAVLPVAAEYEDRLAVWVRLGDLDRGMESIKKNKDKISRVLVSDHCIAKNGIGLGYRRVAQGDALATSITAWCRDNAIPVYMGLGNYGGGFSHPEIIVRMLERPEFRRRHIQNIRKAVLDLGYDGVDLDYENLPANSCQSLTVFVRELAAALDLEEKALDITVPPKFSSPGWKKTRAYDWQVLPTLVGRVNVMCYDWYIRSGPPGPIIPLGVTKKVIAYIKTCPYPERFWIGHPTYGNDWVKRKNKSYRGRYYGGLKLKKRAQQKSARIFYQSKSKGGFIAGPFAHYTYRAKDGLHNVWYGDHKSLAATIHVVRNSGLGGIFVWRIGFEDPQIWEIIHPIGDETSAAVSSQTDAVCPPTSWP
ncbi:hypothetical protein KAR34_13350 [bacterium]|nr:hypothetical protein [bacterium]